MTKNSKKTCFHQNQQKVKKCQKSENQKSDKINKTQKSENAKSDKTQNQKK